MTVPASEAMGMPRRGPAGGEHALRGVIFLILALLCLGRAAAATPEWTGGWDTHWRNGGAHLDLIQTGNHVTGRYKLLDGKVEATAEGDQLRGQWVEGQRSGNFLFTMAPDGASFTGRYDNGEWWTGGRDEAAPPILPVDQSGVRETLRTFVEAGNLAHDGLLDQLAAAAAVLDFGDRGATMAQGMKIDAAQALSDVLSLTTFHLWSFPGKRTPGDSYVAHLQQAGTDAVLPLTFKRTDGKWFIVAPTDDELAAARRALLARYNGRPPEPSAYLKLHNARDTMTAFLSAFADWNAGGSQRALSTLDTSRLFTATRAYEGLLAAQYLKLVLDRVQQIVPEEIPDDPDDRQPYVVFDHPAGQIVIAPITEGTETVWKFTPGTLRTIRSLYAAVEPMPVAGTEVLQSPPSTFFALRQWLKEHVPGALQPFGPVELWQFVGALVALAACLAVSVVIVQIVRRLLRWDVGGATLQSERVLRWPLRLVVAAILFKLFIPLLGWPEEVRQYSAPVHALIIAGFGVWAGWYLIDALSHNLVLRVQRTRGEGDDIAVSLTLGAIRLAMVFGAVTYVASELSIPTNGLLAGLGLSGLAFAFASKETLSNVFGAGILVADHPFKRGDWIVAGDVQGTVEKVGIRSTRIRTVEDTEAVVPNGKLSDASINNWGSRRNRLVKAKLLVSYGATPAQIESFMDALRTLVGGHANVVPGRTQIGIAALAEKAIELEVSCYLDVRSAADEKAARTGLMLDILRLADRSGVKIGEMAVPAGLPGEPELPPVPTLRPPVAAPGLTVTR